MSANQSRSWVVRWLRRTFLTLGVLVATVVGVSLWLTEPLEDTGGPLPEDVPGIASQDVPTEPSPTAPRHFAWPEQKVNGDPAKSLLLEILLRVESRLERVAGYTATFIKQERIKDKLLPEQILDMKIRHKPFAVYLKFRTPTPGKEVVYAEGHHENKVIAHNSDWTRGLVPRLAVPPDHPLAMADNRHPITDAGLANLVRKLVRFRKMDLTDSDAVTILDRIKDKDGREWLRSVHTHSIQNPERPFARVELLYDPASFLPKEIVSYDWPSPGQTGALQVAERYRYDDVLLDAPLTAIDFDPANPKYSFHRY